MFIHSLATPCDTPPPSPIAAPGIREHDLGWRIIELFDAGGDFVILKMDQVIHFYGFGVAAIVVHQLLACRMSERVSGAMMIFLAWIGSMGLGAFNEVVEFLAFISLDETGVGDMYNTGLDLCFNLAGAFCGAFLSEHLSRRARNGSAESPENQA